MSYIRDLSEPELDYMIDCLNKKPDDPYHDSLMQKVLDAKKRLNISENESTSWFFHIKNDSTIISELVSIPQHLKGKSIEDILSLLPDPKEQKRRIANAFHRYGYHKLSDVLKCTPHDLRLLRKFGPASQVKFAKLLWVIQEEYKSR